MGKLAAVLTVVFCLLAAVTAADWCRPVHVRTGPAVYLPPCELDGTLYDICIETPTRGTLNGVWHLYGVVNNWVDFPGPCIDSCGDAAPAPMPPGYAGIEAGWGLDVYETKGGEVWADDAWLFQWGAYFFQGKAVFTSVSSITGGTGMYEGATGWIGFVGSEVEGGVIKGEICTPGPGPWPGSARE
jgi:hypothetical protein